MPWNIRQINPHLTNFVPSLEGPLCKVKEGDAIREANQISFTIALATPEDYQTLYQQLEYHPEFGMAETHGVFMTEMGYYCSLSVDGGTGRNVLLRFLNALIQFEPMIQEIVPHIKNALGYSDRKEVYEALTQKLNKENFILVLLSARKLYRQGHRDVFHVLAERCFEAGREKEALLSLHLIPTEDALGNFRAAEMFRRMAKQ